jgi:hypothetical protein
MLVRDLGFEIEGSTVERGVLYSAVHRVHAACFGFDEQVVVHGNKKAPW